VVDRLAQFAYSDLPADGRQSLALDTFLQSINNLGLKQHLLVAEVKTMEKPLRLENAYFQADNTCRPGEIVQQVKADDDMSPSLAKSAVHIAVAAADKPTDLTASLVIASCWLKSGICNNSRQLSNPLGHRQLPSAGVSLCVGVVVVVGTSWGAVPTVERNS